MSFALVLELLLRLWLRKRKLKSSHLRNARELRELRGLRGLRGLNHPILDRLSKPNCWSVGWCGSHNYNITRIWGSLRHSCISVDTTFSRINGNLPYPDFRQGFSIWMGPTLANLSGSTVLASFSEIASSPRSSAPSNPILKNPPRPVLKLLLWWPSCQSNVRSSKREKTWWCPVLISTWG